MSTDHLGTVVSSEMKAQEISENALALASGISRQTLRRRLASGDFTSRELAAVAAVLDLPMSELVIRAERQAATA